MPSPFPGMDPYLEDPSRWQGTHGRFLHAISEALNVALPDGFFADIEEAKYDGDCERRVIIRRCQAEGSPAVVFIHVLSPWLKVAGTARIEYLRLQKEILVSETHLIEIDLLRIGDHTAAIPYTVLTYNLPPARADYLVCLHRAGQGSFFEVWRFTLRDSLPRIAVPLTLGTPDMLIDLQAIFTHLYDIGPYQRCYHEIYDGALPLPPLRPEDALWVEETLAAIAPDS